MTTSTKKTVMIELSGGFHGSGAITMRVPFSSWEKYDNGNSSFGISGLLSPPQHKRADKHFCGIDSCSCGGIQRADITLVE